MIGRLLLALVLIVAATGAGAFLVVDRFDFAHVASSYLSHEIGRDVSIASLRVRLGSTTEIDLSGVSVANIPDGSASSMVTVSSLKADILPWSLIVGPLTIPHLAIDGVEVGLERGPNGHPNWAFRTATAGLTSKKPGHVALPTLSDAKFSNVMVRVHTTSGAVLRIRTDALSVDTASADGRVSVKAKGTYNDAPFALSAGLPSFPVLHANAAPFPVDVVVTSGPTTLTFKGTMTDPLDVDGDDGRLEVTTPKLSDLAAMLGMTVDSDVPLKIAGAFSRRDSLWQLSKANGTLGAAAFTGGATLQEGVRGKPDAVMLDTAFDALNLNVVLKPNASPAEKPPSMSLMMDPSPGTLLDIHVAAGKIAYGTVSASGFDIRAKIGPGVLTVDQLMLGVAGGTAKSRISITNVDAKAVVDFDGALTGVDMAQLAKLMGWGSMPVGGPISSQVTGSMVGATLAEARRTNRIFAVAAMNSGTIDRQLMRMASTDVRLLFGSETGNRKLICLLAVANLRDGQGTIAPIRIMSTGGVIAGTGTYDSLHDIIDMTIGTQSSTTSFFALDVPVRITGPITDFSVRPAFGGGARKLADTGLPHDLPQPLKDLATANACFKR